MDDVEIEQSIAYYRERFIQTGMYENKLYQNISSLLEFLQKDGYQLAIATSKPTVFAEQIIKYFNLEHFLTLSQAAIWMAHGQLKEKLSHMYANTLMK